MECLVQLLLFLPCSIRLQSAHFFPMDVGEESERGDGEAEYGRNSSGQLASG